MQRRNGIVVQLPLKQAGCDGKPVDGRDAIGGNRGRLTAGKIHARHQQAECRRT